MKTKAYTFEHVEAITSGDREALVHFVKLFFRETLGKDLSNLVKAKNEADLVALSKAAHRMKTGIRMFGMRDQLEAVMRIELWEKHQLDLESIVREVEHLHHDLERIKLNIIEELNI